MSYDTGFKCVKDDVSPDEWRARVDLAAAYRLVDIYGMTDLIYNYITVRIPEPTIWRSPPPPWPRSTWRGTSIGSPIPTTASTRPDT